MYMYQIITLHTLILHNVICQLYLSKGKGVGRLFNPKYFCCIIAITNIYKRLHMRQALDMWLFGIVTFKK